MEGLVGWLDTIIEITVHVPGYWIFAQFSVVKLKRIVVSRLLQLKFLPSKSLIASFRQRADC